MKKFIVLIAILFALMNGCGASHEGVYVAQDQVSSNPGTIKIKIDAVGLLKEGMIYTKLHLMYPLEVMLLKSKYIMGEHGFLLVACRAGQQRNLIDSTSR